MRFRIHDWPRPWPGNSAFIAAGSAACMALSGLGFRDLSC